MSDPQPVTIVHERDHPFERRETRGCGRCGRGKAHMDHVGTPRSLNVQGSGGNHHVYQNQKRAWEARLAELLEASGLPRGLERVLAVGEMCFPDRTRRDQGNYRFMVEKALGDALVKGEWLDDDDWTRFEFGALAHAYVPGRCWTRLTIFPSLDPSPGVEDARQGALFGAPAG